MDDERLMLARMLAGVPQGRAGARPPIWEGAQTIEQPSFPALPKEAPRERMSWAEVPQKALGNLPQSAIDFGTAMLHPVLHPIDTVTGLYNVGYGLASKGAGALGVEQDPEQKSQDEAALDALVEHFKGRYGSMDAVKSTVAKDPVGSVADLSMVLGGGGTMAARMPGRVGEMGRSVRELGASINPVGPETKIRKTVEEMIASKSGVLGSEAGAKIAEMMNKAYSFRVANALRGAGISKPSPADE